MLLVDRRKAGPGIALVVDVERDDEVDPVLRQVEHVARLHDHLVALHLHEVGELLEVWL